MVARCFLGREGHSGSVWHVVFEVRKFFGGFRGEKVVFLRGVIWFRESSKGVMLFENSGSHALPIPGPGWGGHRDHKKPRKKIASGIWGRFMFCAKELLTSATKKSTSRIFELELKKLFSLYVGDFLPIYKKTG